MKYLERDGQHGARGPDAKLNKAWPLALEITRNISVYIYICIYGFLILESFQGKKFQRHVVKAF